MKGYINCGRANVFITVTLPIYVNFLLLQRVKQLLNSHNWFTDLVALGNDALYSVA